MGDFESQPGRDVGRNPRSASYRKRILIVDDNSSLRSIVREGLELQAGCICDEAVDGFDGIAKAKETQPDLIVLDLAMPKLNGFEAATVLRREMPKIPIVILTMYAEVVGRSLSSAVGVKAVVAKSDGMGALIDCIRGILAS
jgi:CheY-like chemotaxis protein